MLNWLIIYAKQMRVTHWTKNVMLYIPFVFMLPIIDFHLLGDLTLGFLAFSLAASGVYIVNDLCDKEQDKLHPKKKHRPIASGKIPIPEALLLLATIWGLSLFLCTLLPPLFGFILLGYLGLNLGYSFHLKHVVIADIILVAIMYLMRIYAGTSIIEVEPSSWIQLTTFAGSLFLITAKRYGEAMNQTRKTRKIIEQYPPEMLKLFLSVALTLTLVFYGLYAIEKSSWFVFTVPFVIFGMFRYCFLVFYHDMGENPEKTLFDPLIIAILTSWIVLSGVILSFELSTFLAELMANFHFLPWIE